MSIWSLIGMFLSGLSLGLLLRPMIDKHEKKITKRIEELEKERNSIKEKESEELKSSIIGVKTSEE